jgi:hypothetical protein
MTTPFDTALDALRQQRDRLSAELRRIVRLIDELEAHVGTSQPAPQVQQTPQPAMGPAYAIPALGKVIPIQEGEFSRMSYAEAARIILRRAGGPLTTRELEALLEGGGRKVQGRDPYRLLYRTLMKHSAFRVHGGRWALGEWDKKGENDLLTGT